MHLNIRSLAPKVSELEILLDLVGSPKVLILSETWLSVNCPMLNISGYNLISSPRKLGRGGGVAAYLHNSVSFMVKDKSCDHVETHNIDYLLLELTQLYGSLCYMYCPPNTPVCDILSTIEQLKLMSKPHLPFILGGDFNVNLLNSITDASLDFINNIYTLDLYPIISLPTRVTETSATLIYNFYRDIKLLPTHSHVIKIDLCDHFIIELQLNLTFSFRFLTKRNFSTQNTQNFLQN